MPAKEEMKGNTSVPTSVVKLSESLLNSVTLKVNRQRNPKNVNEKLKRREVFELENEKRYLQYQEQKGSSIVFYQPLKQ